MAGSYPCIGACLRIDDLAGGENIQGRSSNNGQEQNRKEEAQTIYKGFWIRLKPVLLLVDLGH